MTTPLFKKLNADNQKNIAIINAPPSFEIEVNQLAGVEICTTLNQQNTLSFMLIFVMKQTKIEQYVPFINALNEPDPLVWFAYPKGTSKKFKSDIHRDKSWDVIKNCGFDTVRIVAIDSDWSALRFRRIERIGVGK